MSRLRLKDCEVKLLGLKERPKEGIRNPRYYLDEEQLKQLKEYRESTLEKESNFKNTSEDLGSKGKVVKKESTFVLSAWNDKGYMMDIDQYCLHYKLPRKDIHSYKLVSHTGTPYYNILFKENMEEVVAEIDIDSIVQKHIKPIKLTIKKFKKQKTFDRLVYTDTHIGMTPDENGFSLYGGKWDEEELNKRLEIIIEEVIQSQSSNVLYIDDLGDLMDGWDGETVRKGHSLPQNMDNEEAFDVAVGFKVKMIDKLINFYDKIYLNNICNDNHSGSFGYVVNSTVKKILELKYKNVEVFNQRRFMSHYVVGKHAFVTSHGKDSKALKFGFKPQLDSKQIEKIDGYLKKYKVYQQAEFIEFSKGDSHQLLFDYCTSADFDYMNYGALSPSSEWVQTNFKEGESSAVFFNIEYDRKKKVSYIIYF